MGDEQEGDADVALQVLQFDLHVAAQLAVECRERLVEKQHGGAVDEGAGERHALLLAARELIAAALAVAFEAHHGERLVHRAVDLGFGGLGTALAQAIGNVVGDRQMRKQRVVLEHHVDRPAVGRDAGDVLARG